MPAPPESRAWFSEARFGIFLHWGLFTLHGRDVWSMYNEQTPPEENRVLAERFTAEQFDADEWAAIAADAGARYMVLCTRQHDGFSLFDSRASDFTSARIGAKRDFVGEFAEALHRAGLGVGFYYSLLDWRVPAYWAGPERDPSGWSEYLTYVHDQVRELCTNYGKVDILWYDGYWPHSADAWRTPELNASVRAWQPGILINNRSGYVEDFGTPEQQVPHSDRGRLWEACVTTMRWNWGYCPGNTQWKTTTELVADLVQCASFNCNYLLNIGPHPDGSFPPEAVERLREIGRWLRGNGESVYGTSNTASLRQWHHGNRPSNVGLVHSYPTTRDHTLYTHVLQWPGKELVIGNIANRVLSARFVDGGLPITFRQEGSRVIMSELPQFAPDPYNTVIALECDGVPASVNRWPHMQQGPMWGVGGE